MSRKFEFTLRMSLWLLFLAAVLHALLIGWVGLTFGLSLWDVRDVSPTAHWLAALAYPVLLYKLVRKRGLTTTKLVAIWLGAWAFVAYYLLFYLGDGHILDCGFRWSCP